MIKYLLLALPIVPFLLNSFSNQVFGRALPSDYPKLLSAGLSLMVGAVYLLINWSAIVDQLERFGWIDTSTSLVVTAARQSDSNLKSYWSVSYGSLKHDGGHVGEMLVSKADPSNESPMLSFTCILRSLNLQIIFHPSETSYSQFKSKVGFSNGITYSAIFTFDDGTSVTIPLVRADTAYLVDGSESLHTAWPQSSTQADRMVDILLRKMKTALGKVDLSISTGQKIWHGDTYNLQGFADTWEEANRNDPPRQTVPHSSRECARFHKSE